VSTQTFLDDILANDSSIGATAPSSATRAVGDRILVPAGLRTDARRLAVDHGLMPLRDRRWFTDMRDASGMGVTLQADAVPARAYAAAGAAVLMAIDGWLRAGRQLVWLVASTDGCESVTDVVTATLRHGPANSMSHAVDTAVSHLLSGTALSAWDTLLLTYLPGDLTPPAVVFGTDMPVIDAVHETLTTLLTEHMADGAWPLEYEAGQHASSATLKHAHLLETARALAPTTPEPAGANEVLGGSATTRTLVVPHAAPQSPAGQDPRWWNSA
jgi:hypothetical protein